MTCDVTNSRRLEVYDGLQCLMMMSERKAEKDGRKKTATRRGLKGLSCERAGGRGRAKLSKGMNNSEEYYLFALLHLSPPWPVT